MNTFSGVALLDSQDSVADTSPTAAEKSALGLLLDRASTSVFDASTAVAVSGVRWGENFADAVFDVGGRYVVIQAKSEPTIVRLLRPRAGAAAAVVCIGVFATSPFADTNVPLLRGRYEKLYETCSTLIGSSFLDAFEQLPRDVELEMRLVPPPIKYRKLAVRLHSTGREEPRVFYDPDRD
jgi:hypothetical protein